MFNLGITAVLRPESLRSICHGKYQFLRFFNRTSLQPTQAAIALETQLALDISDSTQDLRNIVLMFVIVWRSVLHPRSLPCPYAPGKDATLSRSPLKGEKSRSETSKRLMPIYAKFVGYHEVAPQNGWEYWRRAEFRLIRAFTP